MLCWGLVLLAALSIIAVAFLPECVSLVWHVRFGQAVQFRAYLIPVPWPWWAFRGAADDLVVQRMRRGDPDADSEIMIYPLDPRIGHEVAIESYENALANRTVLEGYAETGRNIATASGSSATCVEFTSTKRGGTVAAKCVALSVGLRLDFVGRPAELHVLYDIMKSIRKS